LPTAPPYRADQQLRQPDRRETTRPAARAVQAVESANEPEPPKPLQRTPRTAWAALAIVVVAVAGGVWVAASPNAIQVLKSGLQQAAAIGSRAGGDTATADLDARWQRIAFWPVIKREFPDWYGDRLRETAAFTRENRPPSEITKSIADQLIALRRQNAALALSASTPRLKALAAAFLDNLKQLKARSTQACFSFISQGEGTPGVAELLQVAESQPTGLQLQVAAIFEAIAEGRKSPVEHAKPQKADYDALMDQLAKLGWSQTDVATFADPRALARAEPAKVCQMVQDWFVAHIALPDEGSQERLLGETLRPVVSG
jgi:hypothetical protein